MKSGLELIAEERQKQIDKHGFTGQHHADHPEWYDKFQLQDSDLKILGMDMLNMEGKIPPTPSNWDVNWFNDLCERAREERLIIAGALIAAEIDRLNALEERGKDV